MDVQRLEECLVQLTALLVVTAPVERLRVFKELQAKLDDLRSDAEVPAGVSQPGVQALSLPGDLMQSSPDLGLGQGAVCGQVDEVGLFGVECAELFGELGVEELRIGLLVIQHGCQFGTHGGGELSSEPEGGVVSLNRFLDAGQRCVGQLADVLIAAGAEEVSIDAAVSVGGVLDEHATALTAETEAGAAEQGALEFVVVDAP